MFAANLTLSSGDGNKTITVAQTDAAGNVGSSNRTFVLDTAAPVVAITSPAAGTSASSGLTIQGTCQNGLSVQIAGSGVSASSVATCASGAFSASITFSSSDGNKTIVVSQTDAAGNIGQDTRDFTRATINLDGAALYTSYCASCHGALATSTKRNRTTALS